MLPAARRPPARVVWEMTRSAASPTPRPARRHPGPTCSKSDTTSFPTATFFEVGINISRCVRGGRRRRGALLLVLHGRDAVIVVGQRGAEGLRARWLPGVRHQVSARQCRNPVLVERHDAFGYTIEGRVQNTGFGTVTDLSARATTAAARRSSVRYACNASNFADWRCARRLPRRSLAPLASVCYRSSSIRTTNGQDDVVTASASAGGSTVTAMAAADCPNIICRRRSLSPRRAPLRWRKSPITSWCRSRSQVRCDRHQVPSVTRRC